MNPDAHPAVRQAAGLILDISRTPFDFSDLNQRFASRRADLEAARDALFAAAPVNASEDRAALHWLLRGVPDCASSDQLPVAAFRRQHDAFLKLAEFLEKGHLPHAEGANIKTVVQIGTGGSSLGPRLIAEALVSGGGPDVRFLSSPDDGAWQECTADLKPESTVFLVVSKSLGTAEVLANAGRAREWLSEALSTDEVAQRLIAVTAVPERARDAGFDSILEFDKTIGGRFSWASAAGLGAAVALGRDRFEELLDGAAEMDGHFAAESPGSNLPMLAAMLDYAVREELEHGLRAVIGYGPALRHLAEHFQQVEMESTGKPSVRQDQDLRPWLIPGAGPEAEHAFFQALHQSRPEVPVELIAALRVNGAVPASLAQMLGQADALWLGEDQNEPNRRCPGRRPVSLVLMPELTPRNLGALLAFEEHKIYATATLLGVNAFDQYGVELGKQMRRDLNQSPVSTGRETTTSRSLLDRARDPSGQ